MSESHSLSVTNVKYIKSYDEKYKMNSMVSSMIRFIDNNVIDQRFYQQK